MAAIAGVGIVTLLVVGILAARLLAPSGSSADAIGLGAGPVDEADAPALTQQPATGSPGTTIYQDTFDAPLAGLLAKTSATPAEYERGYTDGEYAIKLIAGRTLATAAVPGVHGNAEISVDARRLTGGRASSIVLFCRAQVDNQRSRYGLLFDTEGRRVRLTRADNGSSVSLTPWTPIGPSAAGAASTRLALDCQGDTIAASVDGKQVASAKDDTYKQGRFYIGLTSGGPAEARFDNLRVVQGPSN
jgi:hypothetical protein